MSIKLFVTDLDGTLLVSGRRVSIKNAQAVRDMVNAGVVVTLATGRMFRAALPIAQALNVDVPLITYNGALIKSTNGEVFHTDCLEPALAIDLIKFCQNNNWHVQTYDDDILRYAERNDLSIAYEESIKVTGEAVGRAALIDHVSSTYKLLIVTHGNDESDQCIDVLMKNFNDRIDAVKSNPQYVEITAKGVSKASALRLLAAKLNVTIDQTLAIGDSGNDLPMLRAAGVSVAMGNAADDIKAACSHVTTRCEDDGFAAAVYKYVLNDRGD